MATGPVDQYGCQVGIKSLLLKIYSEEGVSGAERAEPLMEKIDVIQRCYLWSPSLKFREALDNKCNTILKFCKEVNGHKGRKIFWLIFRKVRNLSDFIKYVYIILDCIHQTSKW